MATSRNWVFTVNNPVTPNLFRSTTQFKFVVGALEQGSTIHYQGYLELTTSRSMTTLKSIFSDQNPPPHLEKRLGTRQQAIRYVLKTYLEELPKWTGLLLISQELEFIGLSELNGTIQSTLPALIIFGLSGTSSDLIDLSCQKRTVKERLQHVKAKIQNGASELEIANEDFELYIKYARTFNRFALLCSVPRSNKTKLIVIQGPTGSGKSHYSRERFPEAFWKPRNLWWDGYSGQKAVIIDEYYGWLPYDLLLRLGDQYPLQVENKGGSINFNSEYVVFTTNKHPSNWYANVYFEAFVRRVEEWIVIKDREDIVISDNYLNTQFINC